jgi:hypothetical protein
MMIRTTHVMRLDVFAALLDASLKTKVDMCTILVRIMQMLFRDYSKYVNLYGQLKYQKRTPKGTKKRVHIHMSECTYDYFQDMRKVFRKSISFMFAIAVEEYLDQVIEELLRQDCDKNEGNYPLKNYAILEKRIENITCWLICWGIPEDITRLYD